MATPGVLLTRFLFFEDDFAFGSSIVRNLGLWLTALNAKERQLNVLAIHCPLVRIVVLARYQSTAMSPSEFGPHVTCDADSRQLASLSALETASFIRKALPTYTVNPSCCP